MNNKEVTARMILQQCISARLQVTESVGDAPGDYVEIGRGVVAYVCFMKGANTETVQKMINMVTSVKLSRDDAGKLVSIVDLPGSILVVPQATLGGKQKGKRMQYHANIDKQDGLVLYKQFVNGCGKVLLDLNNETITTKCGTYGNLQVLNISTNGPYTHVMELT